MMIIAVSLGAAFSISELLPYVSPEYRVKSSRLKREDDVRRSLIGDMMVRLCAMDIEGLRNEEIRVERGVFGKPRLQFMREPWDYNISHSGKWVTGIVGRKGQRVGIDIQKMDAVNPSLSRYTMSAAEIKQYLSLPPEQQKQYLYELWTRKESYLKMEGIGINVPIRSVFLEENPMYAAACYFKQYAMDSGYKLTACSTDFRFPDECLVVKSTDLAEVFLRRCREQTVHLPLNESKLPIVDLKEPVLQ
ncbi:4'-phosphopantetheinyl transferase superfamily protein [Paenibacillus sp. BR2-3]|uniref:4'-phosphopantetheinyl transferase family protein n=1 Tax=Paenibacillus sp. BR2-3 TaxID=3048494 RepID=UPI003977B387